MRGIHALWLVAALVLHATPSFAQAVLYAAADGDRDGSAPSSLYTVDAASGEATLVGPIEGPDPLAEGTRAYENVSGLAFVRDGRLLATADGDDFAAAGTAAILIEIERETGAATFIGVVDDRTDGTCGRIADLGYDPDSDTTYAIGTDCDPDLFEPECNPETPPDPEDDYLYTIDPLTGVGTAVGVIEQPVDDDDPDDEFTPCPITSAVGNGLAARGSDDVLFAARGNRLVRIDFPNLTAVPFEPRRIDETRALDASPFLTNLFGATYDDARDVEVLNTFELANAATTLIGEFTVDGEPLSGVDALAFRGPAGCPIVPVALPCRGPGKTFLSFDARDGKLKWKWARGAATSLEDWGDPVDGDTHYRLCWYDSETGLFRLEGGTEVPPGEGWSAKGKGFVYRRPKGADPGIDKLKLKAGPSGRAKILARGEELMPTLPLPQGQDPAVRFQLLDDTGQCWETELGDPADRNDETGFKDKSG